MFVEFIKSLFKDSKEWEDNQSEKFTKEILDNTGEPDYNDPQVDFEILEDLDG